MILAQLICNISCSWEKYPFNSIVYSVAVGKGSPVTKQRHNGRVVMNAKKFITAFIAGFAVMFLLSGLWYQLLMADFYKATSTAAREPQLMGSIALGYIVLSLLMAYMYPKGYSGGSPAVEGVKFGILIGLLWIVPLGLVIYGVMTVSGKMLVADIIWHIVEQGVGGIVIGLVYGKQSGIASQAAT